MNNIERHRENFSLLSEAAVSLYKSGTALEKDLEAKDQVIKENIQIIRTLLDEQTKEIAAIRKELSEEKMQKAALEKALARSEEMLDKVRREPMTIFHNGIYWREVRDD